MMERRAFISGIAGGLLAAPLAAEAQQAAKHTIGVLNLGSADSMRPNWDAFREGLRDRGYVEGDGVAIEFRSANGQADRLPALVAELLALKVKMIVITGTTSVEATKHATNTTPIVIAARADPVAMGVAQSLVRPGGNVTGLSILAGDMSQKRLELLRQAVPRAKVAGYLLQSKNPGNAVFVSGTKPAAPSLGFRIHVVEVGAANESERAFAAMMRAKADALVVIEDAIVVGHARKIADLSLSHRLPTMLGNRLYVRAGGLMAYGLVYEDLWRRVAGYVDKILRGLSRLRINLKTAKALGLTIPPSPLARADQVIE